MGPRLRASKRTVPSTLKKRSEFLRVRGGASWGTPAFLLQARLREPVQGPLMAGALDRPEAGDGDGDRANDGDRGSSHDPRFGFTVTKKMGNAVVRNRIKRRFKAALCETEASAALPDCDYVVVARRAAASRVFADLKSDFAQAFERIHLMLRDRPERKR